MNQRSRVRRFDDFYTVWGRKVRHDPFKIGEAGAVPVTPTTFKKMKNFQDPPLQVRVDVVYYWCCETNKAFNATWLFDN